MLSESFAKRDSAILFIVGVALFTIGLPAEFISLDARFAVFAQEMLRNGPTFFATTYGNPYPDYPGTSTFMIYLMSLPFGRVTQLSAILATPSFRPWFLLLFTGLAHCTRENGGLLAYWLPCLQKAFSLSREPYHRICM